LKGKVPVGVVKVYRGSRRVHPLILNMVIRWGVSGERLGPVVLLTGYVPSTHWIGACVGIRVELDVSEKRRICHLPYQSKKSCSVRVVGNVP